MGTIISGSISLE